MTMQPGSDGAVDLNVKVRMVLTDEEFVEQIKENPCLQFIISAIHHRSGGLAIPVFVGPIDDR